MPGMVKIASLLLLALLASGCTTTYVPISWGLGDKVKEFSSSDPFLVTLFDRYDPERKTLRVAGASFDEVMMPSEVKYHLGAYRLDTKLIYRNLFQEYSDAQLRSLMLHELAHHVWHTGMSQKQREQWIDHLAAHPSPFQAMVRRVYPAGSDYNSEDFAFTVEHARAVDLEELARLQVLTAKERDALLGRRLMEGPAAPPHAQAQLRPGEIISSSSMQPTQKGKDHSP